jgi:hypothetical protein
VKNAISGVYPNYSLDFSNILVSRDTLEMAKNSSVVVDSGSMLVKTSPDTTSSGKPTDLMMPLIYNIDKGEAVFSTAGETRIVGETKLATPADCAGDTVEVYLGMISEDGTQVANSIYVGKLNAQ